MATELDTLLVKIEANTSSLRGELAKATSAMAKSMQAMAKESEKLNAALDRIGNKIKASIVGAISGISVGRIARFAGETVEWADALKTTADRIGLNTDQLQELQAAGRDVGLGIAEVTKGLENFSGRLADALSGKGEGAALLKTLGITARETLPALQQIADKIREFDRPSQIAIARTLFGEADALKFLDLLTRGSAGIEQMMRGARETGRVIDRELIAKAAELNQEWQRVGDVGMAAARRQTLEIVTGLTDILRLAKDIGPAVDEWTTRLTRFNPIVQGFKALFDAQGDIRKKMAEQTGGIGRVAQRAVPGLQQAVTTGSRRINLDTAAASAMEGFDKQIAKLRIEAAALLNELNFGPAAAAFKKLTAEFEAGTGKIKPTKKQIEDFNEALRLKMAREGLVALDQMRAQEIATAEAARLEALGQREAAEAVRIKFELTRRFGPEFAAQQEGWINQMARYKVATDDANQRLADIRQTIEGQLTNAVSGLGDAFGKFFESNKAGWDAMRNWASQTLNAIANEILRLTVVQPIAKGVSGLLGGAGGAGGNGWLELLKGLPLIGGLFAEGGRPPLGVPSIVGERGPELFVPDVAGTIIPNRAIAGGTVHLHGAPDSTVRLAQVEAMLQQLGHRVTMVDRSVEPRAINATVDARRRGGIAAF